MPIVPSCKRCVFFNEQGSKCRRFPPAISTGLSYVPSYPEVNPDEWCGEYKAPAKSKKEAAVSEKDRDGVNAIVGAYLSKFREIYKSEPVLSAPDRRAAKTLLQTFGAERGAEIVRTFLESPPSWNKENKTLDLRFIPGSANKIVVAAKPSENKEIWDFLKEQAAAHKDKPEWRDYVDVVRKSGIKVDWEQFVG